MYACISGPCQNDFPGSSKLHISNTGFREASAEYHFKIKAVKFAFKILHCYYETQKNVKIRYIYGYYYVAGKKPMPVKALENSGDFEVSRTLL